MKKLLLLLATCYLMSNFFACTSSPQQNQTQMLDVKIDSTLYKMKNLDRLKTKEDSFIRIGEKKNELICKLAIGKRYRELSQFDSALAYHQVAYDMALKLKDTLELMNASVQLGTNFRRIGNSEEASRYLYGGLQFYDAYSDKKNPNVNRTMISILNGLGNVEQDLGNSRESINLFFRSLNEAFVNTPLNRAINYSNIGDSYSRIGMMDSAKYYYRISLEANLEAKVPTGIGLGYLNHGNLYKKSNQNDSAVIFYKKAYDILDATKDRWHWLISCNALADLYLKCNQLDKASIYVQEGLEEIKTLNSIRGARDVYFFASGYYEKKGNYKEALLYTRLATEMADSLKNEKSSDNINNLKLAYEREVAQHREELLMEQNENQKKSTTIIILFAAAVLLMTITIFTLYLGHTRRKNMKQLQKAYDELKIMHERAERAEQMKSAFIQSISHEIRTPMNAIQGFGGLLISDDYDKETKTEFYHEVEKGIHNLTEQVGNMLDLSNFTTGQINIYKDEVKVQNILKETADEMMHMIPEGVTFRIDMPQEAMEIKTDVQRFSQVLHNLISNACKNTQKGHIALGATRNEHSITFYVEDTGCGIPEDMAEAIFNGFVKRDSFKQGIGIGLRLSLLICDALDATLSYDKTYKNGARFTVEIPD